MQPPIPDVPPFVVATQLISEYEAKSAKNPWRAAEVAAWEQQKRYGGKDSPAGPFWAQVVGEIDSAYRKHLDPRFAAA